MMEIRLAKNSGFCFGVRRAYDTAIKISAEKGKKIFTVGKLIHNDLVLQDLNGKGVLALDENDFSEELEHADSNTVFIIRAHGADFPTTEKLKEASERTGCKIVDCTCPFVKKIHKIMDEHTSENTFTFLFGDENHPEVKGISSHIKGGKLVFTSEEELLDAQSKGFLPPENAAVIVASQTTQNVYKYKKIKKIIENLYTKPLFFDTICNVTENRQKETAELASQCDVMLIIGDKHSSNSLKLYNISKQRCENSFFIESVADLPKLNKKALIMIGVAAGASSPDCLIKEVIDKMSETENFAQLLDESFKTINNGDTVTGTVDTVSNTEVTVNTGTKYTGILTLENVTNDSSAKLTDLFKVGDTVTAVVVRVSDLDGVAVLSKKKSDAAANWDKVVAAKENGEVLEGKVIESNKGGVSVFALGQKIFVPASQTNLPKDADLASLIGTVQKFKIIEIKEGRKSAVGSIRIVAREEKKAAAEAFWSTIEVGKHYNGVVKSLTSYAAFVDLGGVDGMVHMSELSWLHITNPAEVVKVGDTLDVYVKSFDAEKGRISLGYKTEESNPWTLFSTDYNVDDVVNVKIVSILPFGAFAQIIPGVEGLIHISQIANKKLNSPADVLTVGETVDAKIIEIDYDKKKVSLSVRALLPEEAPVEEAPAAEETPAEGAAD